MFKKIFTVMLCFAFVLGVSTLAFAKKAKVSKASEEAPVVKHRYEPKDPLKEKISVALDVFNQTASMRFWVSNHLGIDVTAGFNYMGMGNDTSTYGFKLGGGVVLPMMESEHLNINIVPGLSISTSSDVAKTSYFTFLASGGLEFESFIVRDVFSISSRVSVGLGINSITPNGGSGSSGFMFGLADSFAVTPLIVRFYM